MNYVKTTKNIQYQKMNSLHFDRYGIDIRSNETQFKEIYIRNDDIVPNNSFSSRPLLPGIMHLKNRNAISSYVFISTSSDMCVKASRTCSVCMQIQ